jgi:hypothetical protein
LIVAILATESDDELSVYGQFREDLLQDISAARGIGPYEDMSFEVLKSHSLAVAYSELNNNWSKYTTLRWVDTGEPPVPPMLYFSGVLVAIEEPFNGGARGEAAIKRVSGGLWKGFLELDDGNLIWLDAAEPRKSVRERVEVIVVCGGFPDDLPRGCSTFKIKKVQ